MEVRLLTKTAIMPKRQTDGAAGYDLATPTAFKLPAYSRQAVPLQIAMAIPDGYYGQIASRSSLASKFSIDVGAGVIDSDYRGEVKVLLINHSNAEVTFEAGERIAQLLLLPCLQDEPEEVEELSETVRGEGGFGSTGTGTEEADSSLGIVRFMVAVAALGSLLAIFGGMCLAPILALK